MKSPTTGWNSNIVPDAQVPSGRSSRIQPWLTQYAINAAIDKEVGIGVPSKYWLFPEASFGTLATVILKRARRVSPHRTKNVRKKWSAGVRRPMAKAAAAGERPKETYLTLLDDVFPLNSYMRWYTRSAKESSSCPIKLLFFLHRATLPSMKSKNKPKGMNARAAQRFACAEDGPRQYLMEEKIDMTPQKPEDVLVSEAEVAWNKR